MAEIKKKAGKNKGIRHALTLEQQRTFMNYTSNSPIYCYWLPLFTILLGTGYRTGLINHIYKLQNYIFYKVKREDKKTL